jgi:hypothetical protein
MVDVKIKPDGTIVIKTTEPRYDTPRWLDQRSFAFSEIAEDDGQDDAKGSPEQPGDEAYRMGFSAAVALADVAYQKDELHEFFSANITGWEDKPFEPANEREAELHERAKMINDLKEPWHADYSEQDDRPVVGYDESGAFLRQNPDGTLSPTRSPEQQAAALDGWARMQREWDARGFGVGLVPDVTVHKDGSMTGHTEIGRKLAEGDNPAEHGEPIEGATASPERIEAVGSQWITKAAGPGEPIPDEDVPNAGRWTMSDDELNSIRREEYLRGRSEGTLEASTGARNIDAIKLKALLGDVIDEIGLQPWETIDPAFQLTIYRQLVRRLGFNVNDPE